jgi:hypothetical protein
VAAPGAFLLLSVPGTASEHLQQALAPPGYFAPPNHVRIFQPGELAALVARHGLELASCTSHGFYWALWWALFWTCDCDLERPRHPLLRSWEKTWGLLLASRDGPRIKQALDDLLPKSQIIIARKPCPAPTAVAGVRNQA